MIEPSDFFDLAGKLSSEPNLGEASFRTAISRAYYAAYHEVKQQYASKKGLELSDRLFGNHQSFIRELQKEQAVKAFRKIGNQLYSLKKDRFIADYELVANVAITMAKKSLNLSGKIIEGSQNI